MRFELENAQDQFVEFWDRVGATGDLEAAAAEWRVLHNSGDRRAPSSLPLVQRGAAKAIRLARELPLYIRYT